MATYMKITRVMQLVAELETEIPFIIGIRSKQDYLAALNLVDDLIGDLETNGLLLDLLVLRISEYEAQSDEFKDFNDTVNNTDKGTAVLRVLMTQHGLNISDFQDEIGDAATVSMIVNDKMQLSLTHIQKLAARFNVSNTLFI